VGRCRRLASFPLLGLVVLVIVALVAPAATSAPPTWEPVPGGWVSGPIEYVETLPVDAGGGVGATRLGKYLYVTTWRSFSIYDVSDVMDPQLESTTPLPSYVFNEQPNTDGKILLLTKDIPGPTLNIWDVRDKTSPSLMAEVALPKTDHMWTCVLGCRYAYGGRGTIVDLRDPAAPRIVGDWANGLSISRYHAINEVAPGLVMTGSLPVYYLDGRKDPAHPKVVFAQQLQGSTPGSVSLASANPPPAWLDWPLETRDRFALISTETPFSGPCSEASGSFKTFDTRGWKKSRSFKEVDKYRISTPGGIYTEGRSPYDAVGCSAYAFDTPPNYAKSRRVAVAWFENGLRLLDISSKGKLSEVGGFIPLGGSTSAPIWLDSKTLYAIDMNRGIDILRVGN
jgi:hypothetical protein